MSWQLEIDGELLAQAQKHFKAAGFDQMPTPWLVGQQAFSATCPSETFRDHPWVAPCGDEPLYHVASAEQGFLQLLLDGVKLDGRYQSTTPCFRYEDPYDDLHQPYFYKLELFSGRATLQEVGKCVSMARSLFEQLGVDSHIIQTDEQAWDLVDNKRNIELGSYGLRSLLGHAWTYGTGIALPRFNYVKEFYHE